MPPRKSAAKQPARKKAQDPADTAAPAEDVKKDDAVQESRMPTGLVYILRQYSGLTLGALSIFLTWYTHEGEDPHVMTKLWACCLLGVVALVLHELRPYKRMDYGDLAWDAFFDSTFWKSLTGRTTETEGFFGAGPGRR